MQNPEPFEVHAIEEEKRSWSALASSMAAHLLVILLVLLRPIPSPHAGETEPSLDAQPIMLDQRVPFDQRQVPPPAPVPEDPVALGPECESVSLTLYSEKEPDKGDTRVVDPRLLEQIRRDFTVGAPSR